MVAQTVSAAQTQTATLQPSPTSLTSVLALTPSLTPTQPTPTPTFYFSLYTSTPGVVIETLDPSISTESGSSSGGSTGGDGSSSGSYPITKMPWSCAGNGWRNPANGAVVSPGQSFSLYWTVTNNGTKTWTNNTIDFVYRGGYKYIGRVIQDTTSTVASGGKLTVQVLFVAPKKAGEYNSAWTLQVGRQQFCKSNVTFTVVK